jgi:hypothetical protein
MIKNAKNGYIYNDNGRCIKLDKISASDMLKHKKVLHTFRDLSVDQIDRLSNLQKYIKNSSLPEGIISYDHSPVGIIYPHYFEGYSDLLSVGEEENDLMLSNIRKALDNNLELTEHGIFNTDFAGKNVLYSGSDVQLIDLDGKHIKDENISNYSQVYSYFIVDMFKVIYSKLVRIYGVEHKEEIRKYLLSVFPDPRNGIDKYDPYTTLDEIEKSRILK